VRRTHVGHVSFVALALVGLEFGRYSGSKQCEIDLEDYLAQVELQVCILGCSR
jgi:hypothetical protein